jgi:ABC-type uncharacterized transport system substrate-binding protein
VSQRRELLIAFGASALVVPLRSFAQQQGRVWRVGFLSLYSASEDVQNTATLLKTLRELGYIEGKNLVVEWRFAEGSFERLTRLATELVQLKVDVIVAVASAAISAAKKATSTWSSRRSLSS